MAYPSLRFLEASRLTELKRRTLRDGALLACRVLVVAAAVLALAGPVVTTSGRRQTHASRTARAVVMEPGVDMADRAKAATGAFALSTFSRRRLGDGVADAMRWLDAQPPSRREIVIVAALRRGQLSDGDLVDVPPGVGIRFEQVDAGPPSTEIAFPVVTVRGDTVVRVARRVRLDRSSTTVEDAGETTLSASPVRVIAAPADAGLAAAALRAVLTAGVRWPDAAPRRILLVWAGADEATAGLAREQGDVVVRMDTPPVSAAASAVQRVLDTALALDTGALEPELISPEQLARWSRAPGLPPASAPITDEGDRRWLWGAVLVLLGVESWLRHKTSRAKAERTFGEARVA